jgi:antitoxin CptB
MHYPDHELSRLRWACRRGMLELDLLLLPFFEKRFLQLTPSEQKVFVELLSCTDQELFDWLMSKKIPENIHFRNLVLLILQYAKSSP